MRIEIGTETDSDHCKAITHEYYKCRDAFERFRVTAEGIILSGQNKEISYRAYNAYSYFIHHLYEFLMACHARDAGNTSITNKRGPERTEYLDLLLTGDAHRVVKARIDRISQGRAPSWENHISYYEGLLPIPENFGEGFRTYRNKVSGHASFERVSELNLTEFYKKYHPYLYLLYRDVGGMWGRDLEEFPCLKDVTSFFETIANGT
ncbi:hypothetical protein [Vreelandella lionensis]|uniref:hypothetical protein n=1 Tax=Halomonadaceae TaxID=28256 RepID=UPI0009F6C524|nr:MULTISPECIES: hypothetical protein [Halomonas]MCP1319194.1 hypothetical protein [Halomonas sp. 707B3]